MLNWALFAVVSSIVAAIFGFTGISAAAGTEKILFFIFTLLFVACVALAALVGNAIF